MNEQREVIVTDIRMPFWPMVIFLVKLAIASIPALIILWLLMALLLALLGLVGLATMPWDTFHWSTGGGLGV